MREIKFRAWDIRKSEMVNDALKLSETGQLVTVNAPYFNSQFSFFDGCKWMEYTGLKDKNGKMIYDKDIVKCHFFYEALGETLGVIEAEREIIGEITFQELGLWIECSTQEDSGYLIWINGLHEESFEVIGNIYENPELIIK